MITPERARPSTWLAAALLLAAFTGAAPAAGVEKIPEIRLADLHEREVTLSFEQAPVTLVNFWATWCGPCRVEMPQIQRLYGKYGEKGFRAVGIALESGEAAEVRAFLEGGKMGLSYPMLMGDDQVSRAFGGIEIVPTTFLVGRGGRVLGRYYGVTESFEENLGADIEKHLAGPASKDEAGKN